MTEEPKSLPPEQIFGIAKKFHLELEKLNRVDHGAVVSIVNTMAQHREMAVKFERQQAEEKARAQAMAEAEAAHRRDAERRQAEENDRAEKEARRIQLVAAE
jgi:hypothetical protein